MDLILSKTEDGENVINKTLTNSVTINIKLKQDVDIVSPTLYLRNSETLNVEDFNYFEIPELGRKYFIRNFESVGNGLFRVTSETDYLETYKSEILASKARFNRTMKTGDYFSAAIDVSNIKVIDTYSSGVSVSDEPSMILTTVGEL